MGRRKRISGRWTGLPVSPLRFHAQAEKGWLHLFEGLTGDLRLWGTDQVTPLSAVGQPVGKARDLTANAMALTQATGAAQPLLGRAPAIWRNFCPNGALAGTATGTPGTPPTGWTDVQSTGTITTVAPGTGRQGGTPVSLSCTATRRSWKFTQAGAVIGRTYCLSMQITLGAAVTGKQLAKVTGPAGITTVWRVDGVVVADTAQVSAGVHLVELVCTMGTTTGTLTWEIGLGCNGTVTSTLVIDGVQVETGSAATAYQLTTSAVDCTETGKIGHGFLSLDLTDDQLSGTVPAGLTGDLAILTREGVWIERSRTWATGASFNLGPLNTPLTFNLYKQLSPPERAGLAVLGALAIARTLSDAEVTALANWCKARGGKGLLAAGAAVASWTFDADVQGWTAMTSGAVTFEAGALRVTNSASDQRVARSPDFATVPGELYLVSLTCLATSGPNYSLQATDSALTSIVNYSGNTTTGEKRLLFRATTATSAIILANSTAGIGNRLIDSVSVWPITAGS